MGTGIWQLKVFGAAPTSIRSFIGGCRHSYHHTTQLFDGSSYTTFKECVYFPAKIDVVEYKRGDTVDRGVFHQKMKSVYRYYHSRPLHVPQYSSFSSKRWWHGAPGPQPRPHWRPVRFAVVSHEWMISQLHTIRIEGSY